MAIYTIAGSLELLSNKEAGEYMDYLYDQMGDKVQYDIGQGSRGEVIIWWARADSIEKANMLGDYFKTLTFDSGGKELVPRVDIKLSGAREPRQKQEETTSTTAPEPPRTRRVRTPEEIAESLTKEEERRRRYQQTPEFREAQHRYQQSELGRAAQRRWEKSDRGKERRKAYEQSPKGRAARARHNMKTKIIREEIKLARQEGREPNLTRVEQIIQEMQDRGEI
jgi:hypothetical protein